MIINSFKKQQNPFFRMNVDEENPEDFPAEIRACSDNIFFCRVTRGAPLLQMLKGLMISTSCMVSFIVNKDGVTMITEYQQCIQGSCHLTRACFEEINLPDDYIKFSIQEMYENLKKIPSFVYKEIYKDKTDKIGPKPTLFRKTHSSIRTKR